ncbi:MAG: hypothetical protein EVA89_05665 [Sandaracinaceae bacterium]|nr:MAG: hypothetical protein EVA89_05665 [Sandaracinaceae bacterium]
MSDGRDRSGLLAITALSAPLLNAAAIGVLAWGTRIEALIEARPLLVAAPLSAWVLGLVAARRSAWAPGARFAALTAFALTIYAVATLSGAASAVSLFDRPAALIAMLSAAATVAALR